MGFIKNLLAEDNCAILFFILVFLLLFTGNTKGTCEEDTGDNCTILFFIILFLLLFFNNEAAEETC